MQNDFLPPHTSEEVNALREDLTNTRRLLVPVVIDENGEVIDGRLRATICDELGIDWHRGAELVHGLTDEGKLALRIRLNILRRSTPPTREQRQHYIKILLKADPTLSTASVAKLVGVDPTTVGRHRSRLVQMQELPQPTEIKGLDGKTRKVTRSYLRDKGDLKPVAQALDILGDQKPDGRVSPMAARVRARQKQRYERVDGLGNLAVEGLHRCDFRELQIQPGTVDLVCTDVVWMPTAENDWVELARLSLEWLSPGGIFVTKFGTLCLPKLLNALSTHLEYRWCMAAVFDMPRGVREFNGVRAKWRPFPVFSRPGDDISLSGVEDVTFTPKEKDWDDWQQPVEEYVEFVRRLSPPGGLVLDPCMGTGTTGVACVRLGRRFVGCDIDENKYRIACNRIDEAKQQRGIA